MKTKFFSLCTFFLLAGYYSGAQLSAQLQVLPPYSAYLADYTSRVNAMVISIANSSAQPHTIYFSGSVTGDNGVSAYTKQNFKPTLGLQILPHATMQFTGTQLTPLFNWDMGTLVGINTRQVERSGMLPQGNYRICVDVRDYNTGNLIGTVQPTACSQSFNVTATQPPVITQPTCGSTIATAPGQQILFSWTPAMPMPASQVQYRLRIVEIIPPSRNASDALASATAPPAFEVSVPSTTYLLNPQLLRPSLAGGKYAWAVTATDPAGRTSFSNNGESQACTFTLGSTASSPDGSAINARIGIKIIIGRPSKGCTGFGICDIVPEFIPDSTKPEEPPKPPDSKGAVPDSKLEPKKPKVYGSLALSSDEKNLSITLGEKDIMKYQPDKMVYFKGKTSATFEEDNPIGKLITIPAGTYPMSFSGGYYSIDAAVKYSPGLMTSSYYSLISVNCDNCTEICKVKCADVAIEGKSFKDKDGKSWRKIRRCQETQCSNWWIGLCCAYMRLPEYGEDGYDGDWEVGTPDATGGTTWGPPAESTPCTCGTLFDVLQRVHDIALLQGYSWEERSEKLESQLKIYCPALALANLPGMAKDCGFPGAAKELTVVSGHDLGKWLDELLEGMFHGYHK